MAAKKKILIVEDSRDVSLLVQLLLNERGYQTHICPTGTDAIRDTRSFGPDLILLDVMLPGLDGLQICQQLKADRALQNIPVIVLTSLNLIADQEKALAVGANDFIGKPFDNQRLLQKIAKYLSEKPA